MHLKEERALMRKKPIACLEFANSMLNLSLSTIHLNATTDNKPKKYGLMQIKNAEDMNVPSINFVSTLYCLIEKFC